MSTLIVRDATLAVNGAPESRRDPAVHLEARVEEVARLDRGAVEQCIEVLQSVVSGDEGDDVEVLLALTIIGIAQPDVSDRAGVNSPALGRRVASRLEQAGDPEGALAFLECLRAYFPGHGALERDYEAVLRRLGMVQDLADRYFQRAQHLLAKGQTEEAIGWYKEVLLLDKTRKDVARIVRDLRLKTEFKQRPFRIKISFPILLAVATPLALVALVFREQRLHEDYRSLPAAHSGDLVSTRRRLEAIETFLEQYPIWHGALQALSERSDLRIEVAKLESERQRRLEQEAASFVDLDERLELLRQRARLHAELHDFETALEDFEQLLELAPEDWEHRARCERDVAAIRAYLGENEPASEEEAAETTEAPESTDPESEAAPAESDEPTETQDEA